LQGIILKDNARYDYTEAYLQKCGHIFCETNTAPERLDFIIFPFMGEFDESIYNDSYFASLRSDVLIFSGVPNEYIAKKCSDYDLSYYAMTSARDVQIKNAVPTSEGVIAHLITNRINTISGSRILVIGYGACGSDLAQKLKSLGAYVYALVRNNEKENMACADSVTPIYLDALSGGVKFDVIINTVPNRILTNEMIDKTAGALLIDIASKPYGFDIEYAKKYNEKSIILPGIPGKYAVKSAGEILGEYIESIFKGRLA